LPARLAAAPFALLPAGASALPDAPDPAQLAELAAFLGTGRPST